MRIPVCAFSFLLSIVLAPGPAGSAPMTTAEAPAKPTVIVIGFVGGYVRHDDLVHSEVQLAARLRAEYLSGVYVQAFENHRGNRAYREIKRLLDVDHDGNLSVEEKQNARIIIYGHSWGASETVTLAQKLEKEDVPVLLTIQVDSVSKMGENDGVIPANVTRAANFYQPNGLVHGRSEIHAADPTRTEIIGNFRFNYKTNPIRCRERYPWFDRVFLKTHTEIECDPKVWNQVESLIRSQIAQLTASASTRPSSE
jgi:hypothetical protein